MPDKPVITDVSTNVVIRKLENRFEYTISAGTVGISMPPFLGGFPLVWFLIFSRTRYLPMHQGRYTIALRINTNAQTVRLMVSRKTIRQSVKWGKYEYVVPLYLITVDTPSPGKWICWANHLQKG